MADIKLPDGPNPIGYPAEPAEAGTSEVPAEAGTPEVSDTPPISGAGSSPDLDPIRHGQAAGVAGSDPMSRLAEDVRNGRLSAEQAVEQLIERAVADVEGGLSMADTADLKETLRTALAEDPTLLALRAELKL